MSQHHSGPRNKTLCLSTTGRDREKREERRGDKWRKGKRERRDSVEKRKGTEKEWGEREREGVGREGEER